MGTGLIYSQMEMYILDNTDMVDGRIYNYKANLMDTVSIYGKMEAAMWESL